MAAAARRKAASSAAFAETAVKSASNVKIVYRNMVSFAHRPEGKDNLINIAHKLRGNAGTRLVTHGWRERQEMGRARRVNALQMKP